MQNNQQPASSLPEFPGFDWLTETDKPVHFDIKTREVNGQLRLLKRGDIHISEGSLSFGAGLATHAGVKHWNNLPVVEMNFVMQGNIVQRNSFMKEEVPFAQGYHNIMYNQGHWEQNRFYGAGVHCNFTVNIAKHRFMELMLPHSAALDGITDNILANKPFVKHQTAKKITPAMSCLIASLWQQQYIGPLRNLHFETKVLELLLLQWNQLNDTAPVYSVLKQPGDKDKIYAARELLLQMKDAPPTLQQLARLCYTNEYKLKNGFKELFNDTVFGYLNTVKLEEAKTLIQNTHKSIAEIAADCGYANPQHFSRAFKKKYGITPGVLRK
ncbi:helix-turn-helix transcriptional regulator [Pseudoflavitalea sp. G-6-1-2]|uniref:helix-turn-helix domain-containing protein n=1 Tax=Pseudoflavitalea sp. G-6-1-2 TaxID=2728841 RepID=UPI00146DA312|nr:AraC family transcriptional regulator [Pseudoflavitalea sp. G-6-1-2]NML21461.1 helix-turn-helix transcriptional regulator [Pseudoflavitalea sp. G-6-1-2]